VSREPTPRAVELARLYGRRLAAPEPAELAVEPPVRIQPRPRFRARRRRPGGFLAFVGLVAVTLAALLGVAQLVPSEQSAREGSGAVAAAFEAKPRTRAPDRVRPSGVPAVTASPGTATRTAILTWGPAVDDRKVVAYDLWLDRLRSTTIEGSARSTGLAFLDCRPHKVAIAAVDPAGNVGPVTTVTARPAC
jgi:hypothetical protein